ncbi:MAG: hypothetical protein JXQ75_19230 [Phycisphaerae bacterium]|nr:hypothetical protein [Phycisphaerae bacterium]
MIRTILALALATVLVLGVASPLAAQINDETVTEGNVQELPMNRPIGEYALAGCFLLAALGIGFWTSRRTNA